MLPPLPLLAAPPGAPASQQPGLLPSCLLLPLLLQLQPAPAAPASQQPEALLPSRLLLPPPLLPLWLLPPLPLLPPRSAYLPLLWLLPPLPLLPPRLAYQRRRRRRSDGLLQRPAVQAWGVRWRQ